MHAFVEVIALAHPFCRDPSLCLTYIQMLRDRDRLLDELTGKMKRLKEDFQYNLSLIEERDAELDR